MNHPTRELLVCIEVSFNETHNRVCVIKHVYMGMLPSIGWLPRVRLFPSLGIVKICRKDN